MRSAKRRERVTVRMRTRERVLLEAAARQRGVHLSEIVRVGSLREARRALRGDGEALDGDGGDGREAAR